MRPNDRLLFLTSHSIKQTSDIENELEFFFILSIRFKFIYIIKLSCLVYLSILYIRFHEYRFNVGQRRVPRDRVSFYIDSMTSLNKIL